MCVNAMPCLLLLEFGHVDSSISQTDVSVACVSVRGIGHKALAFSQGMPPSACLQNNVAPHQVNHVRKTFANFYSISYKFCLTQTLAVSIQEMFCSVLAIIQFSTL